MVWNSRRNHRLRRAALGMALLTGALSSGASLAQPKQFVSLTDMRSTCGSTASGGLNSPVGPLMFDGAGNLFATAQQGGQGGGGMFSLSPSGALQVLDQLPSSPRSFLWAQGPDGNFYGVTASTASPSSGAIIRMTPSGAITTLYTFSNTNGSGLNADGSDPNIVIAAADGNLYGVTDRGGANGHGTLFKLSLSGAMTTLSSRLSTDGDLVTVLIQGADGNFYGAAADGGANGAGTVFQFTSAGVTTVLHTFGGLDASQHNTDGAYPSALTRAPDGTLYGTTQMGDVAGNGNVFTIAANGTFSVLHTFAVTDGAGANADGASPRSLIRGPDGNLYGAAAQGGHAGTGTLFKMTSTGTYTSLHQFSALSSFYNLDGAGPATLIFGGDGFLYGGTYGGGCNGAGKLFKLDPMGYRPDDFDGSGAADLLQFDGSTHQLQVSLMNGANVTGSYTTAITAGYYPVAVGDFDGDGAVDILWTSANNDLYMWFGKVGASGFRAAYAGSYPAGWKVFGAGDINGDGQADILWINQSTNQIAYWLMNGSTRIGSLIAPYTSGYYPVSTGDFDGDGLVDIAWTSAKNDLYIWFGNARGHTGFISRYVTTYPAGWSIVGRGDIDGDGRDDLVWMYNSGTKWGYWLMNGANIKLTVTKSTTIGNTIAAVGDFDGDGLADIIWNIGNGATLEYWKNSSALDVNGSLHTSFSPATLNGFNAAMPVFNSGVSSAITH